MRESPIMISDDDEVKGNPVDSKPGCEENIEDSTIGTKRRREDDGEEAASPKKHKSKGKEVEKPRPRPTKVTAKVARVSRV